MADNHMFGNASGYFVVENEEQFSLWGGPDGEKRAHGTVMEALTRGYYADRCWVTGTGVSVDVAFGRATIAQEGDRRHYRWSFPIAVSMSVDMAEKLRDLLTSQINATKGPADADSNTD